MAYAIPSLICSGPFLPRVPGHRCGPVFFEPQATSPRLVVMVSPVGNSLSSPAGTCPALAGLFYAPPNHSLPSTGAFSSFAWPRGSKGEPCSNAHQWAPSEAERPHWRAAPLVVPFMPCVREACHGLRDHVAVSVCHVCNYCGGDGFPTQHQGKAVGSATGNVSCSVRRSCDRLNRSRAIVVPSGARSAKRERREPICVGRRPASM